MDCIETGKKLVSPFIAIIGFKKKTVYLSSESFRSCLDDVVLHSYASWNDPPSDFDENGEKLYRVQTVTKSAKRFEGRTFLGYISEAVIKEKLPKAYEALEKLRLDLGSRLDDVGN